MSIQRSRRTANGTFNEQLSIPIGYNLQDPNARTLNPKPMASLAYESTQSLVYYSNGQNWNQMGGITVGPTGPTGPTGPIEQNLLVNKTNFVDLVHSDSSGQNEDVIKSYLTIREAVDASFSGDTIIVHPGEYFINESLLDSEKDTNFYFEPGSKVFNSDSDIFSSFQPSETTRKYNILGYGEFYSKFSTIDIAGDGITKMNFKANVVETLDIGERGLITVNSPNSILNVKINTIRQNSDNFPCITLLDSDIRIKSVNMFNKGENPILNQIGGTSYLEFETMVSKVRTVVVEANGVSYINGKMIKIDGEDSASTCIQILNGSNAYINVDRIFVLSNGGTCFSITRPNKVHIRSSHIKVSTGNIILVTGGINTDNKVYISFDVDIVENVQFPAEVIVNFLGISTGIVSITGRLGELINNTSVNQRLINVLGGVFFSDVNLTIEKDLNETQSAIFLVNFNQNSVNINAQKLGPLIILSNNEDATYNINCKDISLLNIGRENNEFKGNVLLNCRNIIRDFENDSFIVNQTGGHVKINAKNVGTDEKPLFFNTTKISNFSIKADRLIGSPDHKLILNNEVSDSIAIFDIDFISIAGLELTSSNNWKFSTKSKKIDLSIGVSTLGNLEINSIIGDYSFECLEFIGNHVSTLEDFEGKFRFHTTQIAKFPQTNGGIKINRSTHETDIDISVKYYTADTLIVESQGGRCNMIFDEISLSSTLNIQGCNSSNVLSEPSMSFKARVLDHMIDEQLVDVSESNKFAIGTDLSSRFRNSSGDLLRDPFLTGNGTPGDNFPLGTHRFGTLIFDVDTLRTTQVIQICGSSHDSELTVPKSRKMVRVEILGKSWNIENGRITTGAYQKAQVVYDVSIVNWHQLTGNNPENFDYGDGTQSISPVVEVLFGNSEENSNGKGGSLIFKDGSFISLNGSDEIDSVDSTSNDCMILWMNPEISTIQRNSSWIIKGDNGVMDLGLLNSNHLAMSVYNNKPFTVSPTTGLENTTAEFNSAFWNA